jgi:hypothetical protein
LAFYATISFSVEPGSSVSIVSNYGLDDRAIEVRSLAEAKDFPLDSVSRQALRSTQPPVQWVPGVLSPGVKRGQGVTLTTHSHLVSRLRMSRSYTSSTPSTSVECSGIALDSLAVSFSGRSLFHGVLSEVQIIAISPLKPSGNYMYHLIYRSVTVYFVFMGPV